MASAASRGLAAAAAVVFDRAFEVVDGVEEDILERGDVGGDVARHGEVEQQHRPMLALRQRGGDLRARDDRFAAGGGGKHDVDFGEMAVDFAPAAARRRRGALASSCACASVRLATSRRLTCACDEMARDQFDGFAGADQQHGRIVGPREGFLRQPHRGRRDRHRIGADAGVGARALGGDEGVLEQAVELRRRACPRARAAAQACFTWPRICGSPSTSESSPVATRNRCRTASAS